MGPCGANYQRGDAKNIRAAAGRPEDMTAPAAMASVKDAVPPPLPGPRTYRTGRSALTSGPSESRYSERWPSA